MPWPPCHTQPRPNSDNGVDIVALFREEGSEVFADDCDLQEPAAAELVREVGRVDTFDRQSGDQI
jgi:hypothetical protein